MSAISFSNAFLLQQQNTFGKAPASLTGCRIPTTIIRSLLACKHPLLLLSFHMAVHTPVERAGIYFVTFTCYRWLYLIEKTDAYDAVYNFFAVLNQKGHQVLGYTIMPNHVHLLFFFIGGKQSLNTTSAMANALLVTRS